MEWKYNVKKGNENKVGEIKKWRQNSNWNWKRKQDPSLIRKRWAKYPRFGNLKGGLTIYPFAAENKKCLELKRK